MDLTGLPLLLVLTIALFGAVVGALCGWNRWPGRPAWGVRALALALVMVLPVAVTADAVNRDYGFYSSWDDLLHATAGDRMTAAASLRHQRISGVELARATAAAIHGHGTVLPWTMQGSRSGILRSGYLYLPAAYFDKTRPTLRFPVVEFLHGYIGSPHNWIHAIPIGHFLDAEIAAGRMPPVIAVAPKTYDSHDGECVDAVRGQRNETYLADDVPSDIATTFRTSGSWATLGFSTGGFCAVNMALHYPRLYRAAISLSGYFTALTDKTTGNLYHGRKSVRLDNSPIWWVRHHAVRTAIYAFASKGDPAAYAAIGPFYRAVPVGVDLTVSTMPAGGHNAAVWQAALPPALDWLGSRLPGPTTSALAEPGARVVTKPPTTVKSRPRAPRPDIDGARVLAR